MTKREAVRLRVKVRTMRSGIVEAIGLLTLGDPVRAKEALAATYERSWSTTSPDPGIRGHEIECRICARGGCGQEIPPEKRAHAQYCSPTCRKAASARRVTLAGSPEPAPQPN